MKDRDVKLEIHYREGILSVYSTPWDYTLTFDAYKFIMSLVESDEEILTLEINSRIGPA